MHSQNTAQTGSSAPQTWANLLDSLQLTDAQRRWVETAHRDAPAGTGQLAREAAEYGRVRGNTGAGLLLHRLRRGDHFDAELAIDAGTSGDKRKVTGWRWTRGSHGETWVRDPNGRDVPPKGYAAG